MMFDQFKEKFHAVQQDLTDGFKSLSVKAQNVGKTNRGPDTSSKKTDVLLPGLRDGLHISAGADLLDRFQGNWTKIHQDLEESAKKADETDVLIKKIAVVQQKRLADWQGIKKQLNGIPSLVEDIQKITAKIGNLAADFDEVETLLLELEDVLEEEEHHRNEQIQRQELERYRQQKIQEEDLLKVRLQEEFNEKLKEKQSKEDDKMRERQRAFQEFFDEDLKHYKEFGQMQRSMETPSSPDSHLGDFELEWDEHDQKALDDFLGPSEDPGPAGKQAPQGPKHESSGRLHQATELAHSPVLDASSQDETQLGPSKDNSPVPDPVSREDADQSEVGVKNSEETREEDTPVAGEHSGDATGLGATDRSNEPSGGDVSDFVEGDTTRTLEPREELEVAAPSQKVVFPGQEMVSDGGDTEADNIPDATTSKDEEDSDDFQDAVDE